MAHLEFLLAIIQLYVESVRPIPVPIDDVCPAISVKVCQGHTSPMLHWVFHT